MREVGRDVTQLLHITGHRLGFNLTANYRKAESRIARERRAKGLPKGSSPANHDYMTSHALSPFAERTPGATQLTDEAVAYLVPRLIEGFEMRRRAATELVAPMGPSQLIPQHHPSVFGTLVSQRASARLAPPPYEGDDRWAYVEALLTAPTLEAQLPLVRSIVPPQDEGIVSVYAVGALLGDGFVDSEVLVTLPPPDLSIVVESLGIRGALPAQLMAVIAPPFAAHARRNSAMQPWQALREKLPSRSNTGLTGFRRAVQEAKYRYLPIFGPDVFSMLQALAEPAIALSDAQLDAMLQLAETWGLADVFFQLLTLRLVGPFSAELAFLRRRLTDLQQALSPRHRILIEALLGEDGAIETRVARPAKYFEAASRLLLVIGTALQRRDPSSLIDAVIDLYAIDPALMGFLPWDRISRALGEMQGMDARTAFLTFLMTEEVVRTRYPRVALRFGKGALIADLMSLVEIRSRTDAVNALLGRVAGLPPRAAEALTRAILDRPIIERLASSLPSTRFVRSVQNNERHRISLMTISAVQQAARRQLLPEVELRRRQAREVEALRFNLLQGRLRTGRVRVSWDELAQEVANLFDQDLPISAMQLSSGSQETGLTSRLANYSAGQVVAHLLEGSEHGINQALSSNLRHGVVLPRYLKAFDDALQAVWNRLPLITWDPATVASRMGDEGARVLDLRERVSDLVKGFMDRRLTAEVDSSFAHDLQHRIRLRLTSHFSAGGSARGAVLPRQIINATRSELRIHLRAAVRALTDEVKRNINLEVKALRRSLSSRSRHQLHSYVDSLETCLNQAHDEVRNWTALVSRSGAAQPFKLPDVVALHLMSSALHAWAKLTVQNQVIVDGIERHGLEIRGELLVFFEEVVRNLLSNAFKNSGDELKTKVAVTLVVADGRMTIRCTNAINAAKVGDVVTKHSDTVAQAQRRFVGQAQRDHKSGFQKIRLAYKKFVKAQPGINIPPVPRRSPRFMIELESPLPPGGLFVNAELP